MAFTVKQLLITLHISHIFSTISAISNELKRETTCLSMTDLFLNGMALFINKGLMHFIHLFIYKH